MNNDRGITLVPSDSDPELHRVLDAAPESTEIDGMDRLLRIVADESTAMIDFDGIRQRALTAAKAKKARRGKIRRAASYALLACASLVLAFTLYSTLRSLKAPENGGISALASPSPENTFAHKGNSGQVPLWRMDAGTVSSKEYRIVTNSVSQLFPDALPNDMIKLVDNSDARISAVGTDASGASIAYDLVTSTEPPIELHTGEACSVEDGEYIMYYWQVAEDGCILVRFSGFDQSETDSMFRSITRRIIRIDLSSAKQPPTSDFLSK